MGGVDQKAQTREVTPEEQAEFGELLSDAIRIVEDEGVPYVVTGSIASNAWGRPTAVGDVDLVVDPTDAKRLLKRFEADGYETEEAEPQWLYKAKRGDRTVDLIFELEDHMYLDEPMLERASKKEIEGTELRLISAEDFVITQAISFGEDTPDYWFHALGVLARTRLDWDYLIARAARGPRRVLSLLVFAQANDLLIPDQVIRRLYETTYGS